MSFFNILRIILKMMRANRSRSVLTVLGVSVGIAAIYGFVGIGFGLQRLTESTIATAEALTTLDVLPSSDQLPLTESVIEKCRQIPSVSEVTRLYSVPAQVQLGDRFSDMQVNLVDASYVRYAGIDVTYGENLARDDEATVIVSSAMAKLFGMADPSQLVGQETLFSFYMTRDDGTEDVVRIETPFRILGVFDDDQLSQSFLPLAQVPEIRLEKFHSIKVKVASTDTLASVRDTIADQGYTVTSVADFIEQIRKVFRIVQSILAVFGLIALFVASIGMFNTMTIALLERTHDIGIMKSVGMENRDIWRLFVAESTLIGVFGGLIGILLGMLIGELLNISVNILARSLGGESLDIFYAPLWFLMTILIVASTVGFVTGVYPAYRARRIRILDALRYE